jgi:hypothetical protein
MRQVVALLGLIITFTLASSTVNACTCGGSGTPCESFGSADAVFVGTPVSFRDNQRKESDREDFNWTPRAFKFSVEQAYLGVAGTEIEVSTGYGGGDCGYQFKLGQRYLVYAYRYKDRLNTGICTRTKPFTSANEDLAFLGTLPSAAPGVTIYGEVNKGELKETLSSDILITIDGPEQREIRPDTQGRFRVTGLRAGDYKVSLRLPETLTTWEPQRELSISDRGCAAVTWNLADNGRVSGRVVNPQGEPVPRILVALVEPGADPKDKYTKLEKTDEQGRFTFSAVPRGRYLIAVNHNRFPDPKEPANAYPPSFYPGVVNETEAQTITVGAGEKLNELEIRVPSKRPASILNVTVVWADGSPVANAQLHLMDVTQSESSVNYGLSADAQGQLKIEGYAGQTLVIGARSDRPHTGNPYEPMERTEPKRITLERPTETLRLVITKLR